MDYRKIGAAIKYLRTYAGYTQHQLAILMGVTYQAVSKWERGLSIPDISIITKLSILLNVDVDNLLEGNILYFDKNWQGLLILQENQEVFSGTEIYGGKPLVYFYLSYFMLAGIGSIFISCSKKDRMYIKEHISDGRRYGINVAYLTEDENVPRIVTNTMVVYNNPFVYGPNLTKYFQRAMSRLNGISILTIAKANDKSQISVSYDNFKAIQNVTKNNMSQSCVPILFFPKKYFEQMRYVKNIEKLKPLYAEPMGNGMIEYSIKNEESVWDTSVFLRYLNKRMDKDIYNLDEIAKNRNFLKK